MSKFKQFDQDENGFITLIEASDILSHDPFNFPPGRTLSLLKQFDKDGNGKLDIEEFAGFYAEAKATCVSSLHVADSVALFMQPPS